MQCPEKFLSFAEAEDLLYEIAEKHPADYIRANAFNVVSNYNGWVHKLLLEAYDTKFKNDDDEWEVDKNAAKAVAEYIIRALGSNPKHTMQMTWYAMLYCFPREYTISCKHNFNQAWDGLGGWEM